MAERKIAWNDRNDNKLIGTDIPRLDGVDKASGAAKYSADINTPGTLYAKLVTSIMPHARITKLDTGPAKAVPGVHAIHQFRQTGDEVQWDGTPIVAVAAERPEIAEEACRKVQVEYEALDYYVDDENLEDAKQNNRAGRTRSSNRGDAAGALDNAAHVHKGYYGIHVITHMCMEPHGSHCEFKEDGSLVSHLSTQNVSGTPGQYAGPLGLQETDVTIVCDYLGGGFGSKFAVDEWGLACAQLAKQSGRPVRLMLDRATELKIGGNRPSAFAEVTIAADANGKVVAFDSHHWGSNGTRASTVNVTQMPYVFQFPNYNRASTGINCNFGGSRAWRAPNHPQCCALTQTAMDDLAAKMGIDSYEFFMKNLDSTGRPEVYHAEMERAADLIGWKDKWHPHGQGPTRAGVKQGLGLAMHTWGGGAHNAECRVHVNPDGTIESTMGSQDIGTGTRTVIAAVLAETFGVPLELVKVKIGRSEYPKAGPSGGSTTVGGVAGPNRRAGLQALWNILDKVGQQYNVDANSLSARDQKIVDGTGKSICTWKEAARLVGPMGLTVTGKGAEDDGLTDASVGGVQMADVSVDTETGIIRINKFVAVQDCGLIIDLMTAKSQVYGALIMGIAYALSEEQVIDKATGRFINANLRDYKLPRIGDIGELVVEMFQPDSEYARGVIGLGEPPVIAPGAAISNAVANAIGVRVPVLPMTPKRVLDALKGGTS